MWESLAILAMIVATGSCQDMVTSIPPGDLGTATLQVEEKSLAKPTIRSLYITSNIKYRYATTLVSTRVVNPTNQSGEATFTVTLPESAFISEFLMEIKDKVYKAYVKEKEEAKAIYQQAVHDGQFAGHVALDARDSNQFTVSVNIEAHGKVTFNLTYEQLLARNLGIYSNVINIDPQQVVEDMSVTVNIEEPTAIVNLEVPELQLSNEAVPKKDNEYAKIEEMSSNHKRVIWAPTPDEQRSKNSSGLRGQFIVKYDVDREESPQQILVDEGYFVHFFAPENLPKLRKHVIFVLDFSGSMGGRKLEQLKEAMKQIFLDLGPKDYFSIVIFQSWVEVWSPTKMYITSRPKYYYSRAEPGQGEEQNSTLDSKYVVEASPTNIELARSFMENYTDLGSTNIMGGLRTGLQLVDIGEQMWTNESDPPQPVVVFLTDGQPNVEENNKDVIIDKTKALNTKQSPIFSLAFGYGAEFNFLRKLSLQNSGFARNIYEAADATQQLKNFYKTIASPLLSNVTFSYLPGQVDSSSNTKQEFPVFFSGSELVVAGRVALENIADGKPIGELKGISANGSLAYPIFVRRTQTELQNRSTGHLEKAWSYLTIQQLLDKVDSLDDGEEKNKTKQKVLDLALQYAFVTPMTSLVVVKPNKTESSVDATKVKPGSDPIELGYLGTVGVPPGSSHVPLSLSTSFSKFGAGVFAMHSLHPAPLPPPRSVLKHSLKKYQTINSRRNSGIQPGDSPMKTSTIDTVDSNDKDNQSAQFAHKVMLQDIKWLQQALNTTDNRRITLDGNSFKLGINETDSTFGDCHVHSDSGECLHLQYCALDVFQDDVSLFLPYKCYIPGDYLGVCCPKHIV